MPPTITIQRHFPWLLAFVMAMPATVAAQALPQPSAESAAATATNDDIPLVTPFVNTLEFGGPVFNAGGEIEASGKPLQGAQAQTKIHQAASVPNTYNTVSGRGRPRVQGLTRDAKNNLKELTAKVNRAGRSLERAGQIGSRLDQWSNLSAGAFSLYEKDLVGAGQAGANAALSGVAATAGSAVGSAVVGFAVGGPAGGVIGGVVGGVGGAIAGSYAYQKFGEPALNKAAFNVSKELQRQEEQADKVLRRAETDRILLERSGRLSGPIGPSNPSLSLVDLLRFQPHRQADLAQQYEEIHAYAEEIRNQQMLERTQKVQPEGLDSRVEALRKLQQNTKDPQAREKLKREIELLNRRKPASQDGQAVPPLPPVPTAASAASAPNPVLKPPAPCSGVNEVRNSAGLCVCRPGTELVLGQCQPFCPPNMIRDGAGTCVCMSGYEPVGGVCMPKCRPDEERLGTVCLARCGANEERNAQSVCVCRAGFVPTAKGCAPACGPNETRDGAGSCVCSADFERVNGQCLPYCGPGEMRTPDGNCEAGNGCQTDSDCPAGFECGAQKVCLDKRPSGDAAVRLLQSAREPRGQPGRLLSPLDSSTPSAQSNRFSLSQMPGAPGQALVLPAPLAGAASVPGGPARAPAQAPQESPTLTRPDTPAETVCGVGGKCPIGYVCNTLRGVCVQQAAPSGTPTIPTCTTDRDCPGAKCVNKVCTAAPVAVAPPSQTPTGQPAQQDRQWYVLEAVAGFNVCDLGSSCTAAHKVPCTLSFWAAYGLRQSELQEALRGIGKDLMGLVGGYDSARLVSTRVYRGPSATELRTPVSGPPSKLECARPN